MIEHGADWATGLTRTHDDISTLFRVCDIPGKGPSGIETMQAGRFLPSL